MKRLTILHRTTYHYREPVRFGEHRLMFRPLDSHDIRLVDTGLLISPPARVRWMHDVFGNSVALATFEATSNVLELESRIVVDHYGVEGLAYPIDRYAETLPFDYPESEQPDLAPLIERHYPDEAQNVHGWVAGFLSPDGRTPTYPLLRRLTAAIHRDFQYRDRHRPGVQTPAETLYRGSGTCRDFALLMMEAARSLGLAAKFVSGYLYDPALDGGSTSMTGAGYTHAWVQIYLPGAGWVEFDPTNGAIGGTHLIRVAVARDPSQAIPVQGTFIGTATAFERMEVEVRVSALAGPEPRAGAAVAG